MVREAEGPAGGRQRGEALTSAAAGCAEGAAGGGAQEGRPPWRGQIPDPPRALSPAPGPPRAPLLRAPPYPEPWPPAPRSGHPRGSPTRRPWHLLPALFCRGAFFLNKCARGGAGGEDAASARLGCGRACGICALSVAFSQNRTWTQPGVGVGGAVQREAAQGPPAETEEVGAVSARGELPPPTSPSASRISQSPGRTGDVGDPRRGPGALTSPFLPFFFCSCY